MIYLASPYSHPDSAIREKRWHEAIDACAWIAKFEGRAVYSPIVHWHPIAKKHRLPTDHTFWLNLDHVAISLASAVWILTTEGWKTSDGVASEITFARALCRPILYLSTPEDSGDYCIREQPQPEFS